MARDDAWIEEYWEQGFAFVRGVFPKHEIAELSRCFDEILALGQGLTETAKQGLAEFRVVPINGKPTLKFAKWASAAHEGLNRFRTTPRLLSLVQSVLGPDLRQITNQMHYKNPGDGVSFQMHQDCTFRKPDAAYRDLYGSFLQTAIAVDPSTAENGCLQVVPGSHKDRKALLSGGYEGWEANGDNQKVLERFAPAVDALMDPGDVLFWNPFTIHGSQPNRSNRSRRVYINGFARAKDCDNGVRVTVDGKVVPLEWGPETRWDIVEER
jgi:ectoine hydroxylase-related dioxygenase (phytanoyl-CoA dioxygenase family)